MYGCNQVLQFIESFQIDKNDYEEDILDLELTFSRNHDQTIRFLTSAFNESYISVKQLAELFYINPKSQIFILLYMV